MTDLDIELYRQPSSWYWAIYDAGTAKLRDTGRARYKWIAKIQVGRAVRQIRRTPA